MQRWVVDNADRIVRTIVAETGKAYEDAMLAEVCTAGRVGFWAKARRGGSATGACSSSAPAPARQGLLVRYGPLASWA